jgi:hypothetical protein
VTILTGPKFLEKYPDPEAAFTSPRVSRRYRRHVTAYLLNRFPAMAEGFIKEAVFLVGPRLRAIVRYLAAIDNQDTVAYTLEDTLLLGHATFRGGVKPYIQSYTLEDASSDTLKDTLRGGVKPYIQAYTLEDTLHKNFRRCPKL